MRNITRTALSALLAAAIAAGAPTAVALAAEVPMGEEPAVVGAAAEGVNAVAPESGDGANLSAQATHSGTWGTCKWEVDANGALTVHPGDAGSNDESPMREFRDSITSVRFASENGRKVRVQSGESLFWSDPDPDPIVWANVGMEKVTSVDLSGLDTSKVTDMSGMFYGCTSLASLDLSSLDTSKVTDMSCMFFGCSSLRSLDLSGLDTSKVTDMDGLFSFCSSLRSLNLSGLDTSKVTDMAGMFYQCSSLASLDLSALDTSQVTDMARMFWRCISLTSLDLSVLDTSRVTNMGSMFSYCSSLESIDLTGLDTSRVTNMGSMFSCCSSLESLDISGFDMSQVTTGDMFYQNSSLTKVRVGSGYVTHNKEGIFPEQSEGHLWRSAATGRQYTSEEIISGRSGVADTYTLEQKGATPTPAPSPTPTPTPVKAFPDVASGSWYAGVVGRAAGLGLINGYKDGRFGPADNVTRGQVAVILWNMAGKPAPKGTPRSFPDVAAGKYYHDAVAWASSVGVVSGYKTGKFGPEDLVTREQLAAMLANYAGKVSGRDTSGSAADYGSMRDADKVSSWAAKSVGWCFRNKIISGTKDGNVNPQGNATRAETAKMVVFLHDLLA